MPAARSFCTLLLKVRSSCLRINSQNNVQNLNRKKVTNVNKRGIQAGFNLGIRDIHALGGVFRVLRGTQGYSDRSFSDILGFSVQSQWRTHLNLLFLYNHTKMYHKDSHSFP